MPQATLCSSCGSPLDVWGDGVTWQGKPVCDPCYERLDLESIGVFKEDDDED